ncbi:MAG: UvrD-helicase domain-containing protein [Acidimicrobiia bacterium]|nr:MAG: UvrD-helicase domain-containing protein [Acidimicrobiia bacterium]
MKLRDAATNSYLSACPGAGKTHQVVGRYIDQVARQTRRGVALLSFSRSAVEEAISRCGARSDLLRAPHFVGTFDSFIHRFITTPYFGARGRKIRYIDHWGQIPGTEIRLRGRVDSKYGFPLEWFDVQHRGACAIRSESLSDRSRSGHRDLVDRRGQELRAEAARRWQRLVKSDILSCSAARSIAQWLLSTDDGRERVASRLRGRFAEVIVDEMQDCGPEELAILKLCQEAGIALVLVADMDQAVYEFRNAVPDEVAQLTRTLTGLDPMMENRRATPNISAVNTSLRHKRTPEAGLNEGTDHPIHLITGDDPEAIREQFLGLLEACDVSVQDAMVLAHKASDAERVGGRTITEPTGSDQVVLVAHAIGTLTDATASAIERRRAQSMLTRGVLYHLGVAEQTDIAALLDETGINEFWLRRTVAHLARTMPEPRQAGRRGFTDALKARLGSVAWPNGLVVRTARMPTEKSWKPIANRRATTALGLRASTIHSAKGHEYRAVLLVIPKTLRADDKGNTVLDDWEHDFPSEPRRVLYVGASRAQDLLGIAVPSRHSAQVVRVLEAGGVEFEG